MALLSDCWGNLPVPPDPFPWSAIADGRLAPHVSLVFAAIAPHGTLPEAPVAGADATHAALAELGRRFDAARPEATIVLTPHNVHVQGRCAVVLAGTLSGSLEGFDAPEVRLKSSSGPVSVPASTTAKCPCTCTLCSPGRSPVRWRTSTHRRFGCRLPSNR